jgi:hypothetical protein
MLVRIYIQALLVDEELADQVWELWDKGKIEDQVAMLAWWLIVEPIFKKNLDIRNNNSCRCTYIEITSIADKAKRAER